MNPQTLAMWTISGAAAVIAAATIISTIVEVARGKSRPWSRDVIIAVAFHACMALVALRAAIFASGGG
ncbi:MAG: hypothetical protein PHU25_02440 [Deltaproteobacteria bacterium]|nr:hypothetical protein [Deltaproteobacteria bacterium]